jgi:hypothetical protein
MVIIRHRTTGDELLRVDADTLAGADLCEASLCHADLRSADLRGARLWRANLMNADLSGADLCGAVLLGAVLYGADLSGACWDAATMWPYDYAVPPRSSLRDEGSVGCELRRPLRCRLCRKGLHSIDPAWASCPGCLRMLWAEAKDRRALAKSARERSRVLRERSAANCALASAVWLRIVEAVRSPNRHARA